MHSVFDDTNPEQLTLIDILRWRVQQSPQREAYTFLLDTTNGYLGETKQVQITYADLDHQARCIAALLLDQVMPGERALLLYPPGLEYVAAIFGCFYAGVVAVPAYPPRLDQSLQRIQAILQDARASVALTTSAILSSLRRTFASETLMQDLLWIATDAIDPQAVVSYRESHIDPEALALLQYTSGSTSSPKGVMLTHMNLVQNAALVQAGMSLTSETRGMFWLPPYHDMGLMGGILQALYTGYPTLLMTPAAFVQQPLRWLQAISSFRATLSGGPNFAYDLCVKKATPDTIGALDLSSWAVAFDGAEPVRAETLARFAETFASCGFRPEMSYPCYGMAEATLFVSGGQTLDMPRIRAFDIQALETGHAVEATDDQEPSRLLVSCGYIRQGQEVAIVDPQTHTRLPPNTIGEIWVKGPNVAQGYWGKLEETEKTFQAFLRGDVGANVNTGEASSEGPFLRTGDLGFWLEEELFVTGRLKDLIIIRGRNLYPQDIEQVVERSHAFLRLGCCAAFSVEGSESEQLVVVQEVGRHFDGAVVQEVIEAIRQAVHSEFDIEVAAIELLQVGTIPKTTSGKIQRRACRSRFLAEELNAVYRWQRAQRNVQDEAQPGIGPLQTFEGQAFTPTIREIVEWLVRHIAERAHLDPSVVDSHAPFVQFGLNSLEAISLSGELEQWLGRSLSPTLIYDYPSVASLSRYLAGKSDEYPSLIERNAKNMTEPIAVIGLGCRFPGADSPEAFWQMLYDGIDGISEVPATRWNAAQFYAREQATPEKMNTRWGGFLQDIEWFDPSFFALSPREAMYMDPQQRLLLEVAWETFEQAGLVPEKLAGSQTGVFVGISSNDYYTLHYTASDYHQAYTGTGNAHSIAANRLSYFFDFHGPSVAVDTACSSSLFAVHQACQSLRNGECDLALAGGVNVILTPELTITFSQARMMSSDGRCKVFDEAADGYVRGEGCGLVLLKPLADALRDGDRVLSIIRGSAVNQDGRSNGLTAPNAPSQEAVIRRTLQHSGVSPNEISYVETHGSSTPLGDPIEVDALKAVLMKQRRLDQPCMLGAVKTNIGHLEAAAGIAGLIKTVLCLQKGIIVPNLHFKTLNPHISLARTTFEIPTEPCPWPDAPNAPRLAGVSAFGFGGTNVHVILEGAPSAEAVGIVPCTNPIPAETLQEETVTTSEVPPSLHLLTLSGRTPLALAVLAQRYQDFLMAHPTVSVADLCGTANAGRTHFAHRLAVSASNAQQMREHLAAFVAGQTPKEMQVGQALPIGQKRVVFLFPGQGSQYVNMGYRLYETQATFRKTIDECDRLLRPYLPQSLLSILYPTSGATSPINEPMYIQPALFALEYALAQMWLSWGIKPDAVIGQSLGSYVAACVAGLFSLADGLKLITTRGCLMQLQPEYGTMAMILASPEQVQSFIASYSDLHISIAALNGPNNTVIAGRDEEIRLMVQRLEAEGVRTHRLPVSHAFHSPLVDPILDAFEQAACEVSFAPLRIPLVCNLTGQLLQVGETLDAHYWRRQTREAVQFATGIQTLSAYGYELFLDLGPTPVLSNMGKRCLPDYKATWLSSLHQDHDDWHVILPSLASLYCKGYDPNWSGFEGEYHKIALPTYPFERAYCWFKSQRTGQGGETGTNTVSSTSQVGTNGHLGTRPVGTVEAPTNSLQDIPVAPSHSSGKPLIDFGLIFFSSHEAETYGEDYRLVMESARYADQHGFSSVWIPERHFTKDGWLYPSPAVLLSALARETSRIHLRAGSVVAPLHHPLRIAEEWAMVDKLSGGRVGVSFASGWHPNDFALAPETYADRSEVMYRNIEIVRKLWRGETVPFKGGDGKLIELKTYPSPMQHEIPIWLTAAGNPQTFANAGRLGANLLTHMYNQSIGELAEKILIYRESRAEHGYDPVTGKVSVMLHTYVGADMDTVRTQVQGPFSHYIESASYLVKAIAYSRGQQIDLSTLSESDLRDYLTVITDRLIREQRVLFGTPETCARLVTQLQAVGVDEIACQMDFGVDTDLILESLPYLNQLRRIVGAGILQVPIRETVPYANRTGGNVPVPTGIANEINQWFYQLRWEVVDPPRPMASTSPGHWLVFLDQKGIGQHLSLQLQEQGHMCTLIEAGQNFQLLDQHHYQVNPANPQEIKQAVGTALAAVRPSGQARWLPLRGVIHLWSLGSTPVEALNLTALEADQILGVQSALSLIQALIEQSVQTRIWLITQGVQPVEATDTDLAISQAPIWGLGKTCAMEHPELWGGLIDLDPRAIVSAAASQLMGVLQGDWRENQIALRGATTYVARMVRVEASLAFALQKPRALHLTPDAAYLITGGLWGMGLECARWLAIQGARYLILLGRSKLLPRETWEHVQPESRMGRQIAGIRAIEQLGAQVHYAPVDIADSAQLTEFLHFWNCRDRALSPLGEERPPIRGIIHAASVWQDAQGQSLVRPLVNLSAEDLLAVLRPKMFGGWLLSNLLKETPLDFFVSFSSAATLFGSVAQGNYAAASEFLDVLAHYQRAHGQPAISIDWGAISEIGYGATPEGLRVHEYWELCGIGRLSPKQVLATLEILIHEDLARVGVLRLDWQLLRQFYPQMADLPLVSQLVSSGKETGDATNAGTHDEPDAHNGTNVLQILRDAYEEEHSAILTSYVKAQVATILRASAQKLQIEESLISLGFDSLMAIELKNRIDYDLEIRLPIVALLQGPSIIQLVKLVLSIAPVRVEAVGTDSTLSSLLPDGKAKVSKSQDGQSFPLSRNQRALWFLSLLAPESAAYNVLYALRIQQHLDVPLLQRTLKVVAARYPILTSTYTLQDDEPIQQPHENQTLPLEVIDVDSRSLDDLKVLLLEESNRPIDLTKGPVLRLQLYQRSDTDYLLGFILHHIVADFWALDLLVDELSLLYTVEKTVGSVEAWASKRPASPLIPTPTAGRDNPTPFGGIPKYLPVKEGQAPEQWLGSDFQHADYVRWQQSMLQSEEGGRHWQYWQNALAGDLPVLNLPTDRPRPAVQTYKGTSHCFSLSTDLVAKLQSAASTEGVTLFTLMFTAYQVLLHRYSHQDDILVGTPALGRTRSEFERVIGSLANPVIVRARLGHNSTFKDLLQQTKQGVLAALEHQDFPFPLLVELLQPHRDPSYSPLLQTLFIWDHLRTRRGEDRAEHSQSLSLSPFVYGQQGAAFDLALTIFEMEDVGMQDPHLRADFRYNVDLFDTATIARMAEHFLTLLAGICDNLDTPLGEIPLLSEDEQHIILMEWNATRTDFPGDVCVHQFFEGRVKQKPEAIAVVFEDTSLTYRELNSQANHLASRLQQEGIGPGVLIGVCLERSLELVVALLAVLKAGGAYVPLDPNYPQERLSFMLEDAQVPVVLTQAHLRDSIEQAHRLLSTVKLMCLEDELAYQHALNRDTLPCSVQPDNLAYMIYTSGSTGQPKGVQIPHHAVINFLTAMRKQLGLEAWDTLLAVTPVSFDIACLELFFPLVTGARVVIVGQEVARDGEQLAYTLYEQDATIMQATPATWRILVDANWRPRSNMKVLCGGEAFPANLARQLLALSVTVWNLYGPTETTIWSTLYPVTSVDGPLAIGRPIANTQIYLLDRYLQPVPIGVTGELYIGGEGLARGYWRRPELTAQRFIPNPFVGRGQAQDTVPTQAGTRLYRTGDLARYQPDGEIEYLGRSDQQVKLRGFRIEPGEIETILREHPAVQDVVVLLHEEDEAKKYLTAYVVSRAEQSAEKELRSYLHKQLPDYMVPAIFVYLEALPLTSNGKVNRKALPIPVSSARRYEGYMAPQSELEQRLVGIWQEMLGLGQVGIHDNFFALGGHSLLGTQLISRIRRQFGITLPMSALFESPTIAELALMVELALIEEIEQLDDVRG